MQKKHITTIVAVVAILLVGWGIYSLLTHNTLPSGLSVQNPATSTATNTWTAVSSSTSSQPHTATTSTSGLTVSNVKISGSPGSKAFISTQYGFVFAYPEKDAMVIPVSDATPLVYRTDREFAFCVKELETARGCAPVVTLGLADGSGHGISVYVLNATEVQKMYPKLPVYMILGNAANRLYEIYYSDTTNTTASIEQNKKRQDIMQFIGSNFTLLQ